MAEQFSDKEILNSFYRVLPYLHIIFEDDCSYAVMDTEKYLLSQDSKELKLGAKVGDSIQQGGAVAEALRTGNPVVKDVPKEVYGTPFRSYAVPLKENNQVVGIFVLGKSYSKKNEVATIAQQVSAVITQTSAAITDLVSGVGHIANTNSQLLQSTNEAGEKARETTKIVDFIQNIATQTYLLGVNASIDAARAGAYGKGFDVVAEEIGRLSKSTSDSIAIIDSLLTYLTTTIIRLSAGLTESMEIFGKQTDDLDEIAAAILELKETTHKLEHLSELL
ncbi:MAG: methyl-accepting chemotaxis protein [Eubacteriales bacterium]|nr:methyl-accepting chemotaxis protein [Eubacteriales bacterium]